ncbi:endonuclease/exonuclease/phosphatase family protein [Streptomyces sp. CBMA123]|uniref:endonuclease/exonuclease/phosphatase family protein n=1 Tax=Streptomyces sp. CBMA123 TaxID=1896313 RepID=UPI001661E1E8|nr:endonuclease/exonuclease/phosphatase family protein [Streptomyces sp. CBMA123]MBD0695434.1 metal-dependent hydrolase [Streptomyces sp. CBMA123]
MNRQPDASAPAIDVMSFNIHHGEGVDGVLDLERIARVIRSSGAEVVGLQEVDRHFDRRSQWADQATELARLLGYHLAYGANLDLAPPAPGAPRMQYGTAVLSRHPITRSRNTHLFRSPGEEQRGLLQAEIDFRGIPLQVFVAHLELFSETDRTQQVKEVIELIGDAAPAILLGDFNAVPETPEIAAVRAAFTDCWTVVEGAPAATFPTDAPAECIDYVFAGPGVRPVRIGPVTGEPAASDHLPVLARLVVTA